MQEGCKGKTDQMKVVPKGNVRQSEGKGKLGEVKLIQEQKGKKAE